MGDDQTQHPVEGLNEKPASLRAYYVKLKTGKGIHPSAGGEYTFTIFRWKGVSKVMFDDEYVFVSPSLLKNKILPNKRDYNIKQLGCCPKCGERPTTFLCDENYNEFCPSCMHPLFPTDGWYFPMRWRWIDEG